ncbi:hypothetical protein ACFLS9_00605 [Bacteroidota bacterium]
MKKVFQFLCYDFLLLICLIHPQIYCQLNELTLEELCRNSSDIVRVRTIDINSYYSGSEHNRIFSETTFLVMKSYKGDLLENSTFKIKTLGGTVKGITMFAVGAVRFFNDEEAILFVSKLGELDQKISYKLSSIFKGKFDISNNSKFIRLGNNFEPFKINNSLGSINISSKDYFELTQFENLITQLSK